MRLFQLKEETVQPYQAPLHRSNFKMFQLSNKIYLSAVLNWNKESFETKYYNLFIKKSLNQITRNEEIVILPKSCFKYIGSSCSEEFRLCSKLNENIYLDSNQKTAKFFATVYVQSIKENLNGCFLNENELETNGSVQRVDLELAHLNIKDDLNLDFIDEIIYDLEIF